MRQLADQRGFTIIEVLVAVIILGVGVVALVSSSASSTRMIGRGRHATRGVQAAAERMEILRALAYSTTPDCTALASGTDSSAHGIVTAWTVSGAGTLRTLRVVAGYQVPGRLKADTLLSQVRCY
jgi:prepilin-type N-terminal cleavage/methylation domain-containing protein